VIGEGGGGGGGGRRSRIHGGHLKHGPIVGHHRPVLAAGVLPEGERVTAGDDFGRERATVRLTGQRRRE
jgi:hypothetical protein